MRTGLIYMQIGVMLRRLNLSPKRKSKSLILALGVFLCLGLGVVFLFGYRGTKSGYPLLSCKRVTLSYAGNVLTGIEDMAYDRLQDRLFLSAYDRRKAQIGGIYTLDPQNFNAVKKLDINPHLTPHGIDLSRHGNTLYLSVIDRDLGDRKKLSARIRQFRLNLENDKWVEIDLPAQAGAFCNANDLISWPGTESDTQSDTPQYQASLYVTSDHTACSKQGRNRENIFMSDSASVMHYRPDRNTPVQTSVSGLYFANGVAMHKTSTPNTDSLNLYIAETRKKRLSLYNHDKKGELILNRHIALPGGPDNLSLSFAETSTDTNTPPTLWAALHPNLFKFALFRAGFKKQAPSRVAHINPNNQAEIFDIPKGIISGATTALAIKDKLYLGAAFDEALAVCDLPRGLK